MQAKDPFYSGNIFKKLKHSSIIIEFLSILRCTPQWVFQHAACWRLSCLAQFLAYWGVMVIIKTYKSTSTLILIQQKDSLATQCIHKFGLFIDLKLGISTRNVMHGDAQVAHNWFKTLFTGCWNAQQNVHSTVPTGAHLSEYFSMQSAGSLKTAYMPQKNSVKK